MKTAQCPECKVVTHVLLLAGKQGLCKNIKCNITKFTVQDFDPGNPVDEGTHNKSYNNSGR
jgi:hypothetical protein